LRLVFCSCWDFFVHPVHLKELAGNATLLFYGSEEAIEGKTAYLEGRLPDFSKFPRLPWSLNQALW
jgi:hypothetical protein